MQSIKIGSIWSTCECRLNGGLKPGESCNGTMKPSSLVGRCLVHWSLPLLARVGSVCQSTILGSGLGAQPWAAEPWGSKLSLRPTRLEPAHETPRPVQPNNCPTTSIVEPLAGPQERHPAAAKRRAHRTRAVASHQIPEHEAGMDHPSIAYARGASLGRPRVPSGSSSDNEHGSTLHGTESSEDESLP